MTKIFALNPDAKEGEEKVKQQPDGVGVSPTVIQPAFFPVTLPISSIVAKKKKCRISHLIIALLLLWTLVTVAIVFHIVPNSLYRRVHHFVSNDDVVSGSAWPSSSSPQPYVFDIAEPNIRVAPKLEFDEISENKEKANQDGDVVADNRDGRVTENQDNEAKQPDDDRIPNRFEAMKAIETLLKIPGVQQVAVVQNNENGNPPNGIPPPPESFNQPRIPFAPQFQMNEWELMNYRRAMREWLLRREMFRRRMMIELEREREVAAEREMPRFMMGPQQPPQQELPQPEQPPPMMPQMFPFRHMHMMPPMMGPAMMQYRIPPPPPPMMMMRRSMPMLPPYMMMSRIPPMHPFMFPQQQPQQEQPQPEIIRIPIMPPQMLNRDQLVQQGEFNPGPPGIVPPQIQDFMMSRPILEQKKAPMTDQQMPMVPDGIPDRDTIFKEFRSRAQMQQQADVLPVQQQQQQQQQQQMPQPMLPPIVIRPAAPNVNTGMQRNSDEIFRELQQRALRMQIEQDRREAEERAKKESNIDSDATVLMIADTFPRRPVPAMLDETSEEVDETTTTATTEKIVDKTAGNSSEPLSAYFKFFEEETRKSEENNPSEQQDVTTNSNDIKSTPEQSSEENTDNDISAAEIDESESVIKPDNTIPQVNFIQDISTTTASQSKETSEEAQTEPSTAPTSQDKTMDDEIMLGTPLIMPEAPRMPIIGAV